MNEHARLSMLDHALRYAAEGWPVFPCSQDDKRPLVPGKDVGPDGQKIERTGGCWRATTDEEQIRTWWRTRPRAMIGLHCGAGGVFVIDLDAYKTADAETGELHTPEQLKARIEAFIGVELPETLTSCTPRGGWHMVYALPADVELTTGLGALRAVSHDDIDIRAIGGYIILPPSVRSGPKAKAEGCDGVAYAWRDAACPIAEPPPRLIDALLSRGDFAPVEAPRPAPQPRRLDAGAFSSAVEEARRNYALAALERACEAVAGTPKGGRGKAIMANSPAIAAMIAAPGGYLTLSEAVAAFTDAALRAGLTPKDDELRTGLIERMLSRLAPAGVGVKHTAPFDFSTIGTRAGRVSARPPVPQDERGGDDGFAQSDGWAGFHRQSDFDSDFLGLGGVADLSECAADHGLHHIAPPPEDDGTGEGAPSGARGEQVSPEVVQACALLDSSDTDNAARLLHHFGADLVVQALEGTAGGDFGVWSGQHWDFPNGAQRATLLAQKVGDRIGLEPAYFTHSPAETEAIDAAKPLRGTPAAQLSDDDKEILAAGKEAEKALKKRIQRRMSHGVTTKNAGRIKSMLEMAAPRLRKPVEAFNADRYAVACLTHTLRFRRYPDADIGPDDKPRFAAEVVAEAGHRREDLITALVPTAWQGADAMAEKWLEFMAWALPDAEKRRTVQQFMGLGLLALPVQHIMLHYGTGANGKSVALEVLSRVLGPSIAVGLPQESIMGVGDRAAGGASPDIARLWGKRMLRVNELKPGAPLQSELVKRLTGGESFPVRTLFKGYFEFQNVACVHMSANGKPVIDGSDYGIVRRVLMAHWDQTVPEDKRRDFEEMVSEMVAEGPGILAWLAEGVRDFLANGLVIAPSILKDTADYARDMDPFGRFAEACIMEEPGSRVQGKDMAAAYNAWASANGERDKDARQVGKGVRKALERRIGAGVSERIKEISGVTQYLDFKLQNVPQPEPRHRGPATPAEDF